MVEMKGVGRDCDLDADDHVFVLFDADDVPCVAFGINICNASSLGLFEIRFDENFAAGFISDN